LKNKAKDERRKGMERIGKVVCHFGRWTNPNMNGVAVARILI